jgi:putative ABC transport system permease protein
MKLAQVVESTVQDVGYALRSLKASPGFTLVAALSLALGIGANTAIFSLIDALLLRTLPVRDPAALAVVGDPTHVGSLSIGSVRNDLFSYPLYRELRGENRSFAGLLASGRSGRIAVEAPEADNAGKGGGAGAAGETARGRLVSGNYFAVLGVEPYRGRLFAEADEGAADEGAPGAAPYAVLSYSYWRRRFALDPGIVGRKLAVNSYPFTVVGVAPPGFLGEIVGAATDVWLPLSMQPQVNPGHPSLDRWDMSWLMLMGRLRPGVSLGQARAEMSGLFQRTLAAHTGGDIPSQSLPPPDQRRVSVSSGAAGLSRLRPQLAQSIFTLMAMVGVVLLIACANVANLLLERATARQKEIGVRLALGAAPRRLVRQLLTESVLLAGLGGALGALFAFWAAATLIRLLARGSTVELDLGPNLRLLAFTFGVSLLTGLLFGLAPALRATRVELAPILKENARGVHGGAGGTRSGGRHWPLGKILVVAQFALSLLLLVGAGLFVRTLLNLERLDLGYDKDGLVLMNADPAAAGYEGERLAAFAPRLVERLRAVPGVAGASVSENGIFSGTESGTTVRLHGAADPIPLAFDLVGPDYFQVVGIPLRGREFSLADKAGAPPVAIVNQAMARKHFAGRDPLGQRFVMVGPPDTTYEIVGVAGDARDHELRGEVAPRFYVPFLAQSGVFGQFNVEVRTRPPAAPAAIVEPLRRAVAEFDPKLPRIEARPLAEMIGDSLGEERAIARLSAAFGLVALLLAAIGLYGVISYAIARRTAEIGIRMALGAGRSKVVWMILRETLVLAAIGIVVGVPATLAAARAVASRLFGLSVADPGILVLATAVLLAVALAAGAVPGSRAARVQPMSSLRAE